MREINKPEEIIKVFNEKEKIIVNSPIAFVDGKLYYFVPLAKQRIKIQSERENRGRNKGQKKEKKKNEKGNKKGSITITYLGVLGFAHGITIAPSRLFNSCDVAQLQQLNGYFAQLDFEIGDVQFVYYKNQDVQLKKLIKEALFEEGGLCKCDRSEIDKVVGKLTYYVKYDSEITPYVIACWILGTYLFPMFNYYPYLYFRAEKGAGKGTNLQIISRLAWNATDKFVASTEAPLFRLIEKGKPTLIIDEYHRLLRNPHIGPAIESILESGSERGAKVVRCKEGDPNVIEHFDVYTPKVLASRRATEIEEKSIVIILQKTNDVRYAERRKELDFDKELDGLKEKLLRVALTYWQDIYEAYQLIKPSAHLTGRQYNFWAPILAIASVIFPEKYEEIREYAEEVVKKQLGDRFEIEDIVLTALFNNRDKLEGDSPRVTMKELKEWCENQLHHQTILSALTNLKLIKTSRAGTYYLRKERLEELFAERGFVEGDEEEEEQKELILENIEKREEEVIDFTKLSEEEFTCKGCGSQFSDLSDLYHHQAHCEEFRAWQALEAKRRLGGDVDEGE